MWGDGKVVARRREGRDCGVPGKLSRGGARGVISEWEVAKVRRREGRDCGVRSRRSEEARGATSWGEKLSK